MSVPSRSYVEISRSQIAENYRAVCSAVDPGIEVMGVVKADAYGHGAVEVSRALAAAGAKWLAVSSVEEGATLRRAGLESRILVMAGVMPYEREALIEFRLTPVVHALEDLAPLDALAGKASEKATADFGLHLKIDSGMGRLGTRAAVREIADAVRALRHARVEGLMTHFASAADYGSTQTGEQVAYFDSIRAGLSAAGIAPAYRHLSSTNALAYARRDAWGTMVRPGHALYGYVSPARGHAPRNILKVQPALTWKARIVAVKDIPEGAPVGYGGSFRAPRAMRIAILAAGYADGIPHRLSNRGKVIAGGRFAAILGTVSMDLTTIDVTQSPELQPGDAVTLLGREGSVSLDAQEIARTAGTISYNVLCGIGARVKRVYV